MSAALKGEKVDVRWLLDNRPGGLPRDLKSIEFLMIAWGFRLWKRRG